MPVQTVIPTMSLVMTLMAAVAAHVVCDLLRPKGQRAPQLATDVIP